jgi:hypothetical protein
MGHQRSGTTWLANQLSAHPEVAAVRHEQHKGVHESIFFSHVCGRFGDLRDKNNFIRFVEFFGASDYARLADASKEFLYSLYPASYEQVFRQCMESYASRQGCSYWLEKSPDHTPQIRKIAGMFPRALFIGIRRCPRDVAASALKMAYPTANGFQKRQLLSLMKYAWSYTHYNRELIRFNRKSKRCLIINYGDFKGDFECQMKKIEDWLDLSHDESVLRTQFPPNSSFSGSRKKKIPAFSIGFFTIVRFLMWLCPSCCLRVVHSLVGLYRSMPEWYFRLYRQDVGLERRLRQR